jgi:anion-transporting  ArsA/GET3 family ATPase
VGSLTSWGTNAALATVFRPLKSLVGSDLISDSVSFLKTIKDVEDVFVEHTRTVDELLQSTETEFIGVCNPTDVSLDQMAEVTRSMSNRHRPISFVIVNGVDRDEIELEDDLVPFAHRIHQGHTRVVVVPEHERDQPLEIVEEIAKTLRC